MGGWQPRYTDEDPSQERLAEMVIKLEREVYRTKRPRQLARRDLLLRIGEPIDVSRYIPVYLRDAQAVRHGIAERLRDEIHASSHPRAPRESRRGPHERAPYGAAMILFLPLPIPARQGDGGWRMKCRNVRSQPSFSGVAAGGMTAGGSGVARCPVIRSMLTR